MKKLYQSLAATSLLVTTLSAFEYQNTDFISQSMGNAGVASSYGNFSSYVNPALLSTKDHDVTFELGVSIGVSVRENELGDSLSKLNDADILGTFDQIVAGNGSDAAVKANAQTIMNTLTNFSDENALGIAPSAAVNLRYRGLSIGINAFADINVKAVIDKSRLQYIGEVTQTFDYFGTTYTTTGYVKYDPTAAEGSEYSFSSLEEYQASSIEYAVYDLKSTYLDVKAIELLEIPVSMGFKISDKLSVGASVKLMQAQVYNLKVDIDTKESDISDELKENYKRSTTLGVDAGVMYKITDTLRVGAVMKNINSPSFEMKDGEDVKFKPLAKAGVALKISDILDIAFDADITTNESYVAELDSKYIGGGVNFHPASWFSLRAGAMKNTLNDYEGIVYTAGAEVGIKIIQIDLALQASSNTGTYDGEEYPRYVKANLGLISKW